ncbi:DUF5691 domain-containing protein [Streptomyces sp. NPDC051940]|uniref:DUF5691 domain-containing protein n=1 Tax=Streptomyces sp. NPDC051940 TaxID=3155675 RepID=UPI00343DCB87
MAAALLGAGRRTPPVPSLLDAAAAQTVARRAGIRPAAARRVPAPALPDPRPHVPSAARLRLAALLADRAVSGSGTRRGSAPDLAELLPEWLQAANDRGLKAPPDLLPALLDAARARTDLRAQALRLGGSRALWLARLSGEWRFALRDGAAGGPELPDLQSAAAVRACWEEGLFAERIALLAAVRRREPPAAIALLLTSWLQEKAEDRLAFLDSLREGLSGYDEPFLEQALADRSRNVRATAAELLSTLPQSALAARMARRVRSHVVLDRSEPEPVIVVEAPHECDAEMQHDGIQPRPPSGTGERSWWLAQLAAAAPLSVWPELFGDRSPEEITALPVADDWRPDLHAAWCRAATRQRDAAWARALLGRPSAPMDGGGLPGRDPAKLLTVLPREERADWVAGAIDAHGLSEAFRLLGVCAVPWTQRLGRAVVDALEIARDGGGYPWSFSGVMGLAERSLAPAHADRLELLTRITDDETAAGTPLGGGSPGAVGYWSEAFQRLVATLRVRAAMLEELTGTDALRPGN